MEEFVQAFQQKYPGIHIEEVEEIDTQFDEEGDEVEVEITIYNITSIPNLDGLTLSLQDENAFKRLDKIIESKPVLFKDFLGGKVGRDIEVVLSRVGRFPNPGLGIAFQPIKVSIGYESRNLEVEIHLGFLQRTEIGFLAAKMVGIRSQRNSAIARISGLPGKNLTKLETDTRAILRSVLFDIECSYDMILETANLENLKALTIPTPVPRPKFPKEQFPLLYKPYIPELIEYFHTGERVDYLPFKFICYFHIIEYFMDKSAHSVVAKKIKQIIMNPDFHKKSSEYINQAIKIFKTETEKLMTDKIKISRVFSEYINRLDIQKFIDKNKLNNQFENEHTLKFSKELKINAIKFDSESSFCESLTKRIYAIRCSIVHSNPDFDESKAVPFTPTPSNINFLRKEIELIKEISKTIIVNSIS